MNAKQSSPLLQVVLPRVEDGLSPGPPHGRLPLRQDVQLLLPLLLVAAPLPQHHVPRVVNVEDPGIEPQLGPF